ncbi:MAG: restriction endonuclease subunit S [Desulfurococcaceae archaeon]
MTTKKLTDYIKQPASTQHNTKKTEQSEPVQVRAQFKKETEFQETPVGKAPKDWKIVQLRDIGEIVNGFAFPLEYQGKKNGKYIFVKVSDTNIVGNEKYIRATENKIDDHIAKQLKAKIFPSGTIIFPKIGMVIYLRKVRILAESGTFDNNIMGIIPNKDVIDSEFLYYYFLGKINLTKLAGRTTAPSIKKSDVEKLKITLPPIREQQRIAEILSTVDSAIDRVRRLVERADKLKKGLMQELLTKGIGHKEFKETPIGRVPNEWLVYRLGQLAIEMYYGVTAKAVEHYTGTRFLRTTDIKDYKVEWDSLPYCEVTSNNKVNLSKYTLRKGDIIVSRAGTVGMSVYVDRDMPDTVFGSYLIKIRVNDKLIDPKFLHYYLQTEQYWIQILASSKGSTLKNISLPTLKSLVIPVPTLEEQKVIIEILSTVDRYVESIKMRLERLERVKKWLMDVLLTGKVRVMVEPSSGGSSG